MNIKISGLLLLFAFFLPITAQSQIQKMSALSANKFLGVTTIYDDQGEDIWGYVSLYQKDKVPQINATEAYVKDFIPLDKREIAQRD